jgi:hypothetical protein
MLTAALACVASAAAAFRSASPPASAWLLWPLLLWLVLLPELPLSSGCAACGGNALAALLPALWAASVVSRAPPLLSGSWKWLLGPEAQGTAVPIPGLAAGLLGAVPGMSEAAAADAPCGRMAAARCSAAFSHRPSPLTVRRMLLLVPPPLPADALPGWVTPGSGR